MLDYSMVYARKKTVLFVFSVLFLSLLASIRYQSIPQIIAFDVRLEEHGVFRNSTHLPASYRPKILIWAKQYHKIDWTLPDLLAFHGGCDVSWDRNEYATSDAILFYMKSCSSRDLPNARKRSRHQAFVWWAHESPWTVLHYYGHKLEDFNNYFNWTMTYRRDSDILASFAPTPSMDYLLYRFDRKGEMVNKKLLKRPVMSNTSFAIQKKKLLDSKSRMIAWVASDCDVTEGASERLKLVEKLERLGNIHLDKFGKCANAEIPYNYTVLFQTLKPYKFYLAFENSYHCRDYITEKAFYNGLVAGTVPIVHGPTIGDTEKILPKGSFIHIESFKNLTSLAEYLVYLDSNDTAYLEYFKWWKLHGTRIIPRFGFNYGSRPINYNRTDPEDFQTVAQHNVWTSAIQDDMMEIERFGLYHLCRKLLKMDHIKTSKSISNLSHWWYGTENEECLK
ncbi:4-galactosyl-N-acetylglucosaminide 3-alpha-L-fucosyltransferase FUT6-like [Styela clava]